MYVPKFRRAMTDREHQRTSERHDEVAEALAAKLSLTTLPQTEHTAVLGQNTYLQHVPDLSNAVGIGDLRCNGSQPDVEVRARGATQLQRERHDLLCVDMRRSYGRRNGLDHAFAPERGYRQRSEQLFVIGGEEEEVPLRAGTAAGRPIRCRKDVVLEGAPTCTTRSRSPTSMPSSKVLVATMTQSGSAAKAASAARRSSSESEA